MATAIFRTRDSPYRQRQRTLRRRPPPGQLDHVTRSGLVSVGHAGRVPRRSPLAVAALLAALVACAPAPPPAGEPSPAPAAPQPTTTGPPPSAAAQPAPEWRVGASPLPRRPDGFGQILPTPPVLANRRLPTADLLPPPKDGRYA